MLAENKYPTFPIGSKERECVLVFSGGQDSVTCLGIALKHFKAVHCLTFVYGQKHTVEVMCARKIADQFENTTFKTVSVPALTDFDDSALIAGNKQKVTESHDKHPGLPASFVPNRNALFLTMAHAYAQSLGITDVITGVCQTDYSGYPDCRLYFINHLTQSLNTGSNSQIAIHTPLMFLTKGETFKLAEEYNILHEVLELSHTCYEGDHDTKHDWGYGCGACPACSLRANGWDEYVRDFQDNGETSEQL